MSKPELAWTSPPAPETPATIGKADGSTPKPTEETRCVCGYTFAAEDVFCRRCGRQKLPSKDTKTTGTDAKLAFSTKVGQEVDAQAAHLPHPELIKAYVEEGQARKDRWRLALYVAIFLVVCAVCAVLFFKYMPDVLKLLELISDELEHQKNDAGLILLCAIVCILFGALPLPGRGAWNLVVGFVYGWWGIIFLIVGHSCGSQIAFLGARWTWQRCFATDKQGGMRLPRCCSVCLPQKFILLILASLGAIEVRPIKMLLLLAFSPAPSTILAYIVGAKCDTVKWWQFWVPITCSGVKLLVPIYLATKADDVSKLLSGDASDDPVDVVITIGSILLAIGSAVIIGKYSLTMLKASQEQIAKEAEAALATQPIEGIDNREQPDIERESSSTSVLSRVLIAEYAESEEGKRKAEELGLSNAGLQST